MDSPVRFQSLEHELEPIAGYLTGVVCNAGCGDRDVSEYLTTNGATVVENFDLKSTIPGATICDLCNIPRSDAFYDAVICNAVLEHVQFADEVMKEMSRILKKGGYLIVCVPFLQPYHPSPTDFRRYTGDGLRELARIHHFEVVRLVPVHSIAQMLGWIIWEHLIERRARIAQYLLWFPLFLWNRISWRSDPRMQRNASAYQLVLRKPAA